MSVSQTGRGNLPQTVHATGSCPSAFAVSVSANCVPCILTNQGPMSTKLASNFARNRLFPQYIRRVFFSKSCSMHFEKSGTHEY